MAATDARPVPRKNVAFRFYFAIRKSDGSLITSWTGADSEVSIDGAAFSDCTNEATEIGSTGCGYIDFTAAEMNGDAIIYKLTVTNTGALATVVTFFPEEAGDYRVDVVQISGDTTSADNLESYTDGTTPAPVNVTQFGGSNGSFASGRAEVNVSHFGGVAGTFASGRPEVNTTHWKGTTAATVDAAGYPVVTVKDGTGQGEIATTSGAIDTVTTLTNAPGDSSGVTTLLSRLSALRAGYLDNLSAGAVALASTFTGITSLAQWLGLMAGKQTGNSTARTEVRATGAGSGTYDETTDSQEAIRDRGDAAYTTVAASAIRSAVGLASANLDTQIAAVQSDTDDIQTRLPAALVSGRIDASVGAMAANVLTASAIAADAITDAKVASDVTIASVTGAVGSVTGNVGGNVSGNVTGSVGSVATGGITAASFAAGAIDAAAIAADAIGSSELAASAASEIATAVRTELTTELGRVDVAVSTRLATSGYTVPPTVGEIADQVWEEPIADHDGTAGSTADALSAAGSAGDPWATSLPGSYGAGTAGQIVGANLDVAVSSRSSHSAADVWAVGTRTLTSFGTLVADIWANGTRTLTAIADSAGVTTLLARLTSGRAGNLDNLDAAVTTRLAATDYTAPLSAAGTRAAVGLASANLDTQLTAIDDAVHTEVGAIKAVTDKLDDTLEDDGGTFRFTANALEQAPTGGTAPSASDIADAVLDEALAGHATAGTLGKAVADTLAAVDTEVAAIKAKTDNLPSDPADASDVAGSFATVNATLGTIAGYLDTEIAAIKAKTDALPASPAATGDIPSAATVATQVRTELTTELGRLDAAVSTRATSAQVNAEIVDALATDTYAEPGQGTPAATASLAVKVGYLFKAWRNKTTQDATTQQLYADDGTTVDQKATVSDDGTTFTKGEQQTGP